MDPESFGSVNLDPEVYNAGKIRIETRKIFVLISQEPHRPYPIQLKFNTQEVIYERPSNPKFGHSRDIY